ncbi:SDR family oxidoreductase [Dyella tabacisoli]|uniref:Peroxisomal trans-2-enoyl-CoA reductase n=1 Tax=Dyella tabacisoli TaxID=2282381 RepID=A0A369UQJ8_9GAMM|nr:SDR family oxidoreductase [Dyella tabacisoli]RDD82325.1 SDR family NAD(P)-dependent oxidoreductase [Dyella tabacisoli]
MPTSIFRPQLFSGRTVLISGGGSGIGFAIASLFGELGARVVLTARNRARLDQATGTLTERGIEAFAYDINIRNEGEVEALFEQLDADALQPDVLINNAGGQFAAPALDISPNGFRAVVDLNLTGTWLMCGAFARSAQRREHGGRIVNIVLALDSGIPGMAHAAAARAGVVNLTKTLAWEWAPLGLTVNAVAPGIVRTDALSQYDDAQLRADVAALPLPRMAEPEEVAQAVAYLASPAASYITGVTLALDGGEHLTGATPQHAAP